MAIIPIKLVKVRANGKRFILLEEQASEPERTGSSVRKIRCKGEVLRVSGCSAVHGDNKVFMGDRVDIIDAELSEELLKELMLEAGPQAGPPPPEAKEKVKKRKHWAVRDRSGHWELTSFGRNSLQREGYDLGDAEIGNTLDEETLQDAAMDMARYHMELDADGVPSGYTGLRECAADYIHEGLCKALEERRKQGRKTSMEAV